MSVTLSAPGATPGDRHVVSWRKPIALSPRWPDG